MPASDPGTDELTATGAQRRAPNRGDGIPVRLGGDSHGDPTDPRASGPGSGSTVALVALVLGIAGIALGLAVVWYVAAIVVGLAAVIVGILALRRRGTDHRDRSRAVVGTVLGGIAIVLGVSAAILLPNAIQRVDNFFASVQDDVNHNVDTMSRGLQADVNRLDRSTSRDLRRLELQNRDDIRQFEKRSNDSLIEMTRRIGDVESRLSTTERQDLARLEESLRADIRHLDDALHSSSGGLDERLTKLEEKVAEIERIMNNG